MQKKRTRMIVLISIGVVIVAGLIAGWFYTQSLLDRPLGPSLKGDAASQGAAGTNPLGTPDQNSGPNENTTSEPGQSTSSDLTDSPNSNTVQNQASNLKPLCGQNPYLTVLAIGIDFQGTNYLYGLADVIRIVRVDFTTAQVSVLTLDRAIWLDIPGISDHYGITKGLLNQAYFYGVPAVGYYDGPGGGAGLLAKTLKQNFDLDIDNYVVVDFSAFVKFVDALGGIDIDLPQAVDGTPHLPFFNAGKQHLDGTKTLQLARIREKYSVLFRDKNQSLIIQAIFAKITSPDVITKVPKLIQVFSTAGLTDLSPRQIENMTCLLRKMAKNDLKTREIPDKFYVNDWVYSQDMHQNINIFSIDFDIFRSYIREFMKGQWPQE